MLALLALKLLEFKDYQWYNVNGDVYSEYRQKSTQVLLPYSLSACLVRMIKLTPKILSMYYEVQKSFGSDLIIRLNFVHELDILFY